MKKHIIIFLILSPGLLLLAGKKIPTEPVAKFQPGLQKSIAAGKKVYTKYCISCHQADATGVPNMNPPLTGTPYVLGKKDTLIGILLNGLNKNIEIDGNFYSNPMPPLKTVLKDQEIADVLTYVRNSFGNKATGILSSDVESVRKAK